MTQQRVLILNSASREVIRAVVAHMDGVEEYDVAVVDSDHIRRRKGRGLAEILGEIESFVVTMPDFLKLDTQDQKILYLCCLMALYRALLAAQHRAHIMGVDMHLTLMAYILARDGPQFGDIP